MGGARSVESPALPKTEDEHTSPAVGDMARESKEDMWAETVAVRSTDHATRECKEDAAGGGGPSTEYAQQETPTDKGFDQVTKKWEEMELANGTMLAERIANSTSTVFASTTISAPDTHQLILCMASVVEVQLQADQATTPEVRAKFTTMSEDYQGPSTASDVYRFAMRVYERAQFSPECIIIALVMVNRAISLSKLPLLDCNWRPSLLVSMILAQKVWDDCSLKASSFVKVCPQYTKEMIKAWELEFLGLIKYSCTVSNALYTLYYFELRKLYQSTLKRPFPLRALSVAQAARLEYKSASFQLQRHRGHRSNQASSRSSGPTNSTASSGGGGGGAAAISDPSHGGSGDAAQKPSPPKAAESKNTADRREELAPKSRRAKTWEDATVCDRARYVLA